MHPLGRSCCFLLTSVFYSWVLWLFLCFVPELGEMIVVWYQMFYCSVFVFMVDSGHLCSGRSYYYRWAEKEEQAGRTKIVGRHLSLGREHDSWKPSLNAPGYPEMKQAKEAKYPCVPTREGPQHRCSPSMAASAVLGPQNGWKPFILVSSCLKLERA